MNIVHVEWNSIGIAIPCDCIVLLYETIMKGMTKQIMNEREKK